VGSAEREMRREKNCQQERSVISKCGRLEGS
jgi:hypothetical protein